MGILGFQTFIDKKQWYDTVDVREVAEEWKRANPGQPEPVLAVDGAACARYIYGAADKFCGGQYKQFREACNTFVQKFRDSGIQLSFFFDGIPIEEKKDNWVKRRLTKLEEISNMFAAFPAGPLPETTAREFYLTPEAVVPSARVFLGAELGCIVCVATGDCDKELTEYAARSDNCLGVMSNDTDLLVQEGVQCVFMLRHLEMDDRLKARRYSPADIASKLELRREDLPAFSSLVGNDIISRSSLKSLHKRLKLLYGDNSLHENVALFVRDGPSGDVKALCDYAFHKHSHQYEDKMRASIDSYRCGITAAEEPISDGAWGEVLRLAKERHETCQMPAVVYAVMKRRYFRIGEVLEDLKCHRMDSRPTGQVLRPMRARLYAVLLTEWSPDSAEVTELMPVGIRKVLEESVTAARIPPSVSHPGLRALWQLEDTMWEDQRWRLFVWVTSPQANVSALRSLSPPHLVVPAAALWFLRHEADPPLLSKQEAAVFAAVAVAVGDASSRFLAGPHNVPLHPRAVYLASLFVRTVLHVLDAAAACGLSFPSEKDCLPDAYFDGRYFHDVYNASMSQSLQKRKEFEGDPRCYLLWRASYETQFHQLVSAIERIRD